MVTNQGCQETIQSENAGKFSIKIVQLRLCKVRSQSRGALTHCGLVTPYGTENWVNTGSGNGLMPGSTKPLPEPPGIKPLPEPMLTYH